ncbi:NUDIX hydrolase [Spongiibacter sp.]|uniref:NUDIX hydrolase n=1 Tax=Spongiibacter sp. TaxID=2024860 RepID=UPI00356320E5
MKEVYKNPWFSVIQDENYHYLYERGADNGAVVLLLINDGFVFVSVRRPAHAAVMIEAPRGYGDEGETSAACAIREVFEETGYQFQQSQLTKLGVLRPNSAILAAAIDVYLIEAEVADQLAAPQEEVEGVIVIPSAKIHQQIAQGRISDGFTLSALAMYWSIKAGK